MWLCEKNAPTFNFSLLWSWWFKFAGGLDQAHFVSASHFGWSLEPPGEPFVPCAGWSINACRSVKLRARQSESSPAEVMSWAGRRSETHSLTAHLQTRKRKFRIPLSKDYLDLSECERRSPATASPFLPPREGFPYGAWLVQPTNRWHWGTDWEGPGTMAARRSCYAILLALHYQRD